MEMRWIANLIWIVIILGSLIVLYDLGSFSGRIVSELPRGNCNEEFYGALWKSVFLDNYVSADVSKGFKGDTTPTGNCADFDLYKIIDTVPSATKVYFIQHDSSRNKEYLGGIYVVDNSGGTWSIGGTYDERNDFYETLDGVKSRSVSLVGLADAIFLVQNNFNQSIENDNWRTEGFYHIYNEEETKLDGVNFITKNATIFVNILKEAMYLEYDFQSIVPISNFVSANKIKNIEIMEDGRKNHALNMTDHFTNPDGLGLDFIIYPSNNANITIDGHEKRRGNISLKENFHGKIDAAIYVTYRGLFLNSSNNFTINVSNVNDAPVLLDDYPNNFTWEKNFDEFLDMGEFFSDPDGDILEYNITGNVKIDVEIDDNELILIPFFDWVGTENIRIKATDPQRLSVQTNNIILTVYSTSNGGTTTLPAQGVVIISKSPTGSTVSAIPGESKTFLVSATGSNTLSYIWKVNNVDQNNPTESFVFNSNNAGTYSVSVEVSDGVDSASASWSVIVQAGTTTTVPSTTTSLSIEFSDDELYAEGPSFFWLYLLVGGIGLAIIGVGVFFTIRAYKKKAKEMPEYETVRSDEEISAEQFGVKKDELKPVVEFIRNYRMKGFSDDIIRKTLLKKGWKEEKINSAFMRA